MRRLLLDANQSPRRSTFLRDEFGFDVADLMSLGLFDLPDNDVVTYAITERRVIVTEDLHFGRLYHHYYRGQVGIIVMRLQHQSTSAVNHLLHRFFSDPSTEAIVLERSLLLLDDEKEWVRGTFFRSE